MVVSLVHPVAKLVYGLRMGGVDYFYNHRAKEEGEGNGHFGDLDDWHSYHILAHSHFYPIGPGPYLHHLPWEVVGLVFALGAASSQSHVTIPGPGFHVASEVMAYF